MWGLPYTNPLNSNILFNKVGNPPPKLSTVPAPSENILPLILSQNIIVNQIDYIEVSSKTNFPKATFSACDIIKKSAALPLVTDINVSFTCIL